MYCGIIGTNYCGSTMLSYIMGSSPDVFSTGELTHGNERLRCGNWHPGEECPFWTNDFKKLVIRKKRRKNMIIRDRALGIFGCKVILNPDKVTGFYKNSIKNGDRVDFIIILFKKPHAFAYSFLEHQKNRYGLKFHKNRRRASLVKSACSTYYSEYSSGLNFVRENKIPHIVVSYEDLASNPTKTARAICKAMDVRFWPGMVDYWNNGDKLHMVPSGNAGARYQFHDVEKYTKIWRERSKGGHNVYGKEHSDWFLKNYHKVTLDEKWRHHLNDEEKSIINKHNKCMLIYKKMFDMRLVH